MLHVRSLSGSLTVSQQMNPQIWSVCEIMHIINQAGPFKPPNIMQLCSQEVSVMIITSHLFKHECLMYPG